MKNLVFIFNGKILECSSLIEIKSGTTEQEWSTIINETINFYCTLVSGQRLTQQKPESRDLRLIRRLKQSIEFMRKLDPLLLAKYDIKKMCDEQVAYLKSQFDNVERIIKISSDNKPTKSADIYISNL